MKFFKYFLMIVLTLTLSVVTIMADVSVNDDDEDDEEIVKVYLSPREKSITLISACTAVGDLENLKKLVKIGLTDSEMNINEIKEIMIQLYAYCGFPRSLNALSVLLEVSKNGAYLVGPEGEMLSSKADKKKIGTKKQKKLVGKKVEGELYQFAPAIDTYLKEHLFADIFSRGILTDSEREIATIAALAVMGNVEPQLEAHTQIGKNTGLSIDKINEIINLSKTIKQQ